MTNASTDANRLPNADLAAVRRAASRLIAADRRAFIATIGLNAIAAGAGLVGPWLIGRIIDRVDAGSGVGAIDRLGMAIVIFAVVELVVSRYARLVSVRLGERTSARLREEFLGRALALPAGVVERAGVGDLTARGTTDVGNVTRVLCDAAPDVLISTVQAILVLVAVVVVSPILGACGIVGLTGVLVVLRWYLPRSRPAYLAVAAANSALAETIAETAAGAPTIEALGLQATRMQVCSEATDHARSTMNRALSLRTVLFPSVDISYVLPVVTVLIVGGALYRNDTASLGTVVASVLYFRQLSAPLDAILIWVDALQSSVASFARVEGVAHRNRAATPTVSTPHEAAWSDSHDIVISDVHFAYDGVRDVLRGISLSVRRGERLAIVGPSGAGKTTLAKVIAGVETPSRGSVTVGGVPPSALPVDTRQRPVVLVTQEHHVFHDSLRDNVSIAAPLESDAEIRRALDAIGADWIDDLPDGLDTVFGADLALDAARAQQIALARVVIADPATIILDEATAQLDPTSARRVERSLAALLEGRTVIAIAHRLITARDADRIVVMKDGRITEVGTHHDLLSAQRGYATLWRAWHGAEPVERGSTGAQTA